MLAIGVGSCYKQKQMTATINTSSRCARVSTFVEIVLYISRYQHILMYIRYFTNNYPSINVVAFPELLNFEECVFNKNGILKATSNVVSIRLEHSEMTIM
jgi:hypothetical protein